MTTTAKGLKVTCRFDRRRYPVDRKVTDDECQPCVCSRTAATATGTTPSGRITIRKGYCLTPPKQLPLHVVERLQAVTCEMLSHASPGAPEALLQRAEGDASGDRGLLQAHALEAHQLYGLALGTTQ
jgi:hypothetical protein